MAATTGQLGFVTPTQGTLTGTWGDTVNNGITEYTNIAIAGTLTLTNDGAVTLANTTGDNSASNITSTLTGAGTVTAQFAIVRVTGTLTTAKVVTGPAYSKTYTVVNAATGGIVTFKASGQTGVSVAVGESAFVYYNGTDYVKLVGTATAGAAGGSTTQVQYNSSGVLAGSANMTFDGTTLTAAGFSGPHNGTVGATTANTGAFTTLAASSTVTLSGGTANGVTYLNGSKVLTSGSALSFDGTKLGVGTGSPTEVLTLNASTNGTTAIRLQNQGTNIGFISNEASLVGGTSNNFSVCALGSFSLILGASGTEQARLTSTGLGIGTSSFTTKLTVKPVANTYTGGALALVGAVSGTSYITNIGGNLYVSNDGSTDQLVLNATGNLGVGVTPSAWVTFKAVELTGGAVAGIGTNQFDVVQNAYYDGAFKYKTTGAATFYQQSGATHAWYTAPSGTAGNTISFTQAMTLDASNRLLIGTTSASGNNYLQVNSDASIYGVTVGRGAGAGASNTVLGNGAFTANSTGTGNVSIGYLTSRDSTGSDNVNIGTYRGYSRTTGNGNTFVGTGTGIAIVGTGSNNSGVGFGTLIGLTSGYSNSALGHAAGSSNQTGTCNVYIGDSAGGYSTGGSNTIIGGGNANGGYSAGAALTSGVLNTFLGSASGRSVTTGSYNTIIGAFAGSAADANRVVLSDGQGNAIIDSGVGKTIALQNATSVSGIGITFPATQLASTDANTLDDYEEGTWTPATSTSGYTISSSSGEYTKIGRAVFLRFTLVFSAVNGSSNSTLQISGLPFTSGAQQFSGTGRECAVNGIIFVAHIPNSSSVTNLNSYSGVANGSAQIFVATTSNYVFSINYYV